MTEEDEAAHRNDPDVWITIPEFNVIPHKVNYEGFQYSIAEQLGLAGGIGPYLHRVIRDLRCEARRRFTSVAEIEKAKLSGLFAEYVMYHGADKLPRSADPIFANRYMLIVTSIKGYLLHIDHAPLVALGDLGSAMTSLSALVAGRSPRDELLEKFSSDRARQAALTRHAGDPRQADKANVRECWSLWQSEPDRYKGKAAFARDMLSKFESLSSQRVIERWCKDWESELFKQST